MDTRTPDTISGDLGRFFSAPVRLATYANLFYLMLAFPLGLVYFIFLTTGLALGVGLTLIWVGLAVLALVFATSWGITAFERQLAIHLLGADVPPMAGQPAGERQSVWESIKAFLANPVTWKGMAYQLLKLPLGIASFTVVVTLLATTGGFLLAPFIVEWGGVIDVGLWYVDTLGEALLCSAFGVVLLFVSLNLLNGFAFLWRQLATVMLGSERFATPAPPASLEPMAAAV